MSIAKSEVNSPDKELSEYQSSLKKNVRILSNLFSFVLIAVGLYLFVNGLLGIVNRNPDIGGGGISTDNTGAVNDVIEIGGNSGGNISDEGLSVVKVSATTLTGLSWTGSAIRSASAPVPNRPALPC